MRISRNFDLSEFECSCGCEMPEGVLFEVVKLSGQLQFIRDFFDRPVKINSAYRCQEHNDSISGSSKNSQHVQGKAADIVVSGVDPSDVYKKLDELMADGHLLMGGLGKYDTFTHYDIRKTRARWDYTKKDE